MVRFLPSRPPHRHQLHGVEHFEEGLVKVWTNNKFTGHWPVGSAAVVRAKTAQDAADALNHVLREYHSLTGDAKIEDMLEFPDRDSETVRVIFDGNY